MAIHQSIHTDLVRSHGTALLALLPADGSAVHLASLTVPLGLTLQAVGRLATQMPHQVLRDRCQGKTLLMRHPSMVDHGPR